MSSLSSSLFPFAFFPLLLLAKKGNIQKCFQVVLEMELPKVLDQIKQTGRLMHLVAKPQSYKTLAEGNRLLKPFSGCSNEQLCSWDGPVGWGNGLLEFISIYTWWPKVFFQGLKIWHPWRKRAGNLTAIQRGCFAEENLAVWKPFFFYKSVSQTLIVQFISKTQGQEKAGFC